MIPYQGLPVTPATAAISAIGGGHAFVSFMYQDQLSLAMEVSQSFAVDNGAYSAWKSRKQIDDWTPYYEWVADLIKCPSFDFAVIPDIIENASEEANDELLNEWTKRASLPIHIGSPVWHMDESIGRFVTLCNRWPRVCIGGVDTFARPKSAEWWTKMSEALEAICDNDGRPMCKLHGLRMMDPEIFTRIPFSSVDSTTIGRNIGLDCHWKGTYTPPTKEARALVMRQRIEAYQSPTRWERRPIQQDIFAVAGIDYGCTPISATGSAR